MDRVAGQLSLADGLVPVTETVFDAIARLVDWGRLRLLLGPRSGDGKGALSYPAETLLRCLLLGCGTA